LKDWFFVLIINLLVQIETWNFLKDPQSLKLDLIQRLGCVDAMLKKMNKRVTESKELIME
jgi:hypothetical protein